MFRTLVASLVLLVVAQAAPAQEWAKKRLEDSPRHQEYVKVKNGDRTVNCFIVFPEVKEKATAVVVIHEIFGLTDWVRGVADQLAAQGYIAICPDMLSGKTFSGIDEGRKAIAELPPEQITGDLDATFKYVKALPACNGKVAVGGFCWGGRQTFRYATNNPDIAAGFVFYGNGPEAAADYARIKAPIYGFYGGDDARVNMTIPDSEKAMKAAGKKFDPVVYDGAGHGFMRLGEDPGAPAEKKAANKAAMEAGWKRWLGLLKGI